MGGWGAAALTLTGAPSGWTGLPFHAGTSRRSPGPAGIRVEESDPGHLRCGGRGLQDGRGRGVL